VTPLGHLAIDLPAREQMHRRMLLLGSGALIVLSTSPVFGHHVAARADAMLAGHDHILNLCLIALHHILAPVHFVSHALLLVGVGYALWDRARAAFRLARTLGALESRQATTGEPMGRAALRVGLEPSRLLIVQGLPNPAFTAGFWRPHVYVTAALPEVLDAAQLDSVLAHELAHVRRRDPLRLSLLRFLACTLFYIPALRRLADDLSDEAEIDADDRAASRGSALTLASAILALAEWAAAHRDVSMAPAAVGFQTFQRVDLLERRVRRLAGEDAEVGTHVTRSSLAAAGAVLVAVFVSGMMMAHPLPAEAADVGAAHAHTAPHCRHPGELALGHLFCLGWRARPAGAPCPHAGR
jgi:Zn-dependent protease with chaperone function